MKETELVTFSVRTKDDKTQVYRIVEEQSIYFLQKRDNADYSWHDYGGGFWASLDAVVASAKFQNLFK